MKNIYNKTQLHPEIAFERHVFHRDMFAHVIRWTHVLKNAKIGMKILDFGCGNANLLELLYRNRYKGSNYLGLDIRNITINKNKEKYNNIDWAQFKVDDLVNSQNYGDHWDIIVCFEVIEHIGKHNINNFLQSIKKHMNPNTILFLSTPKYDEHVGAANNHIIDGKVGELTEEELETLFINNGFKIEKKYGTFASIKDYKHKLNDWQQKMYDNLKDYYDTNLLSVIMAPFFPSESRNILWRCKI